MKLFVDRLERNRLFCEDELEKTILENLKSKSKLAYRISRSYEGELITIKSGNKFDIEEKKDGKKFYLPGFVKNLSKTLYYLRIISDSNSIFKGNLPLHAAAVKRDEGITFIFGNTGEGKSEIFNKYLKRDSFAIPIGDDHIVVGQKYVFGNSSTRIRRGPDKSDFISINSKTCLNEDYRVIYLNLSGRENKRILSLDEIMGSELLINPVLKYGVELPLEERFHRLFKEELMNRELIEKYLFLFESFMKKSKSNLFLSGINTIGREVMNG